MVSVAETTAWEFFHLFSKVNLTSPENHMQRYVLNIVISLDQEEFNPVIKCVLMLGK